MLILNSRGYALAIFAALTMIVGCGGSQPQNAMPAIMPKAVAPDPIYHHYTRSWMLPTASQGDLLYVSDQNVGDVYAYSWPTGRLMGTLTGFTAPSDLCTDSGGNVYIPNYLSENILEYAHGGTSPIKTLNAPGEYPISCSVDAATGNLAVANISNSSGGPGDLLIYKRAQGTPKAYSDSALFGLGDCGYDNKGNVFVAGYDSGSNFTFAELPKGAKIFTRITVDRSIGFGGGVQWDGSYVTLGDAYGKVIYQVQISGSTGTVKSSTALKGTYAVFQYWIQGRKVVAANITSFHTPNGDVKFWKYPGGGKATKTIGPFSKPLGVTVSLGK